ETRAGRGHIHAVGEPSHLEVAAEDLLRAIDIIESDGDIQIERHYRLGVSVHAHAADGAETNPVFFQHGEYPLEKIAAVHRHRLPELERAHDQTIQRPLQAAVATCASRSARSRA